MFSIQQALPLGILVFEYNGDIDEYICLQARRSKRVQSQTFNLSAQNYSYINKTLQNGMQVI